MKRSFKRSPVAASARPETAERILQAAIRVLRRDGFGALSARSIAAEAGTNLALLNYHFGSKEELLLAIFEELDEELVERQRTMYVDPAAPMSEKWRRAIAFYRRDLADGYVRILQELTAYGYSNPVIGGRVRRRMVRWRALLEETFRGPVQELGLAREGWDEGLVATAISSFWWGMEEQHLIGITEKGGHFFELLEKIGEAIRRREATRPRRHTSSSPRRRQGRL